MTPFVASLLLVLFCTSLVNGNEAARDDLLVDKDKDGSLSGRLLVKLDKAASAQARKATASAGASSSSGGDVRSISPAFVGIAGLTKVSFLSKIDVAIVETSDVLSPSSTDQH